MKRVARGYVASDVAAEEGGQGTWVARLPRIRRVRGLGRDPGLAVAPGFGGSGGRSPFTPWLSPTPPTQPRGRGPGEAGVVPFAGVGPAAGDEQDELAVDADRFQRDDDAWPGHWA